MILLLPVRDFVSLFGVLLYIGKRVCVSIYLFVSVFVAMMVCAFVCLFMG